MVRLAQEGEVSWRALVRGMPVLGADGARLGGVSRLLGDPGRDIFAGIAFRRHLLAPECEVACAEIERITAQAVTVRLTLAEVEARLRERPPRARRPRGRRWLDGE